MGETVNRAEAAYAAALREEGPHVCPIVISVATAAVVVEELYVRITDNSVAMTAVEALKTLLQSLN